MSASKRLHACLYLCLSATSAAGCEKAASTAPEPGPAQAQPDAEATVVKNVDAQPGDTTTCPYSKRTFVVKAEHPQVEYQGQRYWICSEEAADAVRAEPAAYLDDFDG